MTEEKAEYTTEIAPLGIQEITESNLCLMREQILGIPAVPENNTQYATVKRMHIQAKKILPRIEERRKAIKAPHLEKCREIDELAKKAMGMIQPIIDMSAERREAWEKAIEEKKAAELAAEQARLDGIMESIEDLKSMIAESTAYGITSGDLKGRIFKIASYPMTEELFQEHLSDAAKIQADGLASIKHVLENRLKLEAEQAELEAQKKAQAEAQAKIEAAQKAEANRLAKIEAEQKAVAAKAREEQEAAARKLAEEKAAFEAEKKALAKAEEGRQKAEALRIAQIEEDARIETRDRLWAEALPIHIWEYVYPVAMEVNKSFNDEREAKMNAHARRSKAIIRNRNAVDAMTRNILDALEMAKPGVNMPEIGNLVQRFANSVDALIFDLNLAVSEVK